MSEKSYPPEAAPPYVPPPAEGKPYGPPPAGAAAPYGYYTQQGPQPAPTVIIESGYLPVPLGKCPCDFFCPKCKETVTTRTNYDGMHSSMAWIICLGIFLSGFLLLIPFFLCWIPFCISDVKNVEHHCPKCGSCLGTYKPFGF